MSTQPNEEPRRNKSKAKAAGLKSAVRLSDNEALMTSFGKGNDAIPEKHLVDGKVVPINTPEAISVKPLEKNEYPIRGRAGVKASALNPLLRNNGRKLQNGQRSKDMICMSDKLEQMYFGREFDDDLHIQLIYNIIDIEKILAVHVNNIVYELDNMLRNDERNDLNDLIGYMGLDGQYSTLSLLKDKADANKSKDANEKTAAGEILDLFNRLVEQKQLLYFGDILSIYDTAIKPQNFKPDKAKEAQKTAERKEDCYTVLSILGTVRQATAHGKPGQRNMLYKMDSANPQTGNWIYARRFLDDFYSRRIEELNQDFLDKSRQDIYILMDALGAKTDAEKQSLVQDYYDFIVRKINKNMGFSIKHLRETILTFPDAILLTDEKYDTTRSKLYRGIDFVICRYYTKHGGEGAAFTERLRACLDEKNKESLYVDEAKRIFPKCRSQIMDHLAVKMTGTAIASIKKNTSLPPLPRLKDTIPTKATAFTEIIYLLTNFLDGKEINDLLTTLINKFENIASFINVMKQCGIPCEFVSNYALFNNSATVAKELRVVNSFARMSKESPSAKRMLFVEAAQVLGSGDDEAELTKYFDMLLGKDQKDKGFRNFLCNNVIESDRFKYLVRYGNPKKIHKLGTNLNVVTHVMADIPDAQILRYYKTFSGKKDAEFEPEMRTELAKAVCGVSFKNFENVKQQDRGATSEEKQQKEKYKTVIRVYLTVLYLLQKNLVYVNSRYFLAFQSAERDSVLYFGKQENKSKNKKKVPEKVPIEKFAREFVLEDENGCHSQKKRVIAYMRQNFSNSSSWCVNAFRNCTMHLNAVRNVSDYIEDIANLGSYFEIYHYLVQRSLTDQMKHDTSTLSNKGDGSMILPEEEANQGKIREYMDKVLRHRTYCKDFVKAYCVAFAYNLPRFKNLSMNELFDRNNYMPKLAKQLEKEECLETQDEE